MFSTSREGELRTNFLNNTCTAFLFLILNYLPPEDLLGTVKEMTDAAVILSANQAFYDAFASASFDLMKQVWSSSEEIVCIHPGWAPIYGQEAVMQSWQNILTGGHAPKIACHNAIAHFFKFDLCFVTCFESLQGGTMTATNIFLNEDNLWKMIHHHAAPTAQNIPHTSNDNSRLQ